MPRKTGGGRLSRAAVGLTVGALAGLIATDLDFGALVSFWGDASWFVPAAALGGLLLWLTRLRPLVAVATAFVVGLWLVVAFTPLTSWLADGLVRRDDPRPADAVFVFASRLQTDGEPTGEAMSRLLKGVELAAEGRAGRIVVSELPPPSREYAPLVREWSRRFAAGVEVIAIGPTSRSREEAVALARLCSERGWQHVLAVSSPVHTLRAAASLEKEGLRVTSVPAIETRFDVENIDRPDERRRAFGSILHERIGLFVYRRRGWID